MTLRTAAEGTERVDEPGSELEQAQDSRETRTRAARATRNGCKCGLRFDVDAHRLLRKCPACGTPRVKKTRPKHMDALELPYEAFIEINGGEHCAVCGTGPTEMRRLDRDHDHKTGQPRGLLCHRHNRMLSPRMGWTPEALRKAATYLERAA